MLFLGITFLGMFGVQNEFLGIFDKFSKILLVEVAVGGQPAAADSGQQRMVASGDSGRQRMVIGSKWLWVVTGVFWYFHSGKYSLPMRMLDFHER